MSASPIAALVPVAHDAFGRIPVDTGMRVIGLEHVFAAGDIAAAPLDPAHNTVMSCQHARPMGRYAGYNVVGDLLGLNMLDMEIDYYVTCLDLGPWGALYTEGWDRQVSASGRAVKNTKMTINRERIYPPRSGDRREILDAASPFIQMAPSRQA
jgi:NADH dehydrogenase